MKKLFELAMSSISFFFFWFYFATIWYDPAGDGTHSLSVNYRQLRVSISITKVKRANISKSTRQKKSTVERIETQIIGKIFR